MIVKLNGGRAILTLPPEIEYSYSVAKEGYEGVDGTFRLKSKSAFNLSIELITSNKTGKNLSDSALTISQVKDIRQIINI